MIEAILDNIVDMFDTVASMHGGIPMALIIGVLFGVIVQYTRADKFEKIAGFAMLRDTVVPKMLFFAIGLASIGLFFMVKMGYAEYHVKPLNLMGIVVGGILFGISMAIFGKCPGTGPISVAEGRIDVLVGAIGGIFGGLVFVLFYDDFAKLIGQSYGKLSILTYTKGFEDIPILLFGIGLIIISVLIPLKQEFDEEDLKML
jgi:uncharacterized membrane protein YedE/YeeE